VAPTDGRVCIHASNQAQGEMNPEDRDRIKFLEADASIHFMNGDLDAALKGFQEMERFCVQVGDPAKAEEARLAQESILRKTVQG